MLENSFRRSGVLLIEKAFCYGKITGARPHPIAPFAAIASAAA